jgi:hypothetical protein
VKDVINVENQDTSLENAEATEVIS